MADLSDEEQALISEFSLLWSYFEAKLLNESASAKAILDLAREMEAAGQIDEEMLEQPINYFRKRYVAGGKFTPHHHHLHLRANDYPAMVEDMLFARNQSKADLLASALVIVYRYRNNLFHGPKWAYGIRGQSENFSTAISLMMRILEIRK